MSLIIWEIVLLLPGDNVVDAVRQIVNRLRLETSERYSTVGQQVDVMFRDQNLTLLGCS